MAFSDLRFQAEMIDQQRSSELRQVMTQGAWTAYLMGAFPKKDFRQVVKMLGLEEKSAKMTAKAKKAIAKNAVAVAERIKAMDKKRGQRAKTV